jgi:putative ABC transport system permease protein
MLHDLRLALRTHVRRPLFALLIVALLTIGVGANTFVLSLVEAVLLRPFEFRDQDQLAMLWLRDRTRDVSFVGMSYPDYLDLRERNRAFTNLAAMPAVNSTFNLTGDRDPQVITGRPVTGTFFDVLGVRPALGRSFDPDERVKGGARAAVLSDGFWRRRFGGDPTIVGRSLRLDGNTVTVVGVMPPGFNYPAGVDLWTALEPGIDGIAENRETGWLLAIGRLAPGVSLNQASGEVNGVFKGILAEYAPAFDAEVTLTPLVDTIVRTSRNQLVFLTGAVGVLLLIACANVAGLLLARATSRTREIATRLALGADRRRIVRQLLIETIPLSAAGAVAGIALAWWGTIIIKTVAAADIPRLSQAGLNWSLVAFAALLSVVTSIVASLAPARRTSHLALIDALRANSPNAASGSHVGSLGGGLAAAQIALTFLLLVASGLMLRSLANYQNIDLGFDPDGLLAVEIPVAGPAASDAARTNRLFESVTERLAALPDVEASAGVLLRPLWSTVGLDWPIQADSQTVDEAKKNPLINLEAVTPTYFATMRTPLRAGRVFTSADRAESQGVVIVSESFARHAWGDRMAVGRRVKMPLGESPFHQQWLTVVGVVEDVRYRALDVPRLDVYMPAAQFTFPLRHLVLRTTGDPARLVPAVRAEILAMDPNQPITDARPMIDIVTSTLGATRLHTQVLVLFAAIAMGLAAIGLYAVLARLVEERTREIGVRMALGARPGRVLRHVLFGGLKLTAAGLVAGALASAAGMRVMASLVFGVATSDLVTYGVAIALVLAVSTAAGLIPALRAATLDPMQALRQE